MDREVVKSLLGRPIAVNPVLIRVTDSFSGAILLAQAIYWEKTMGKEFWKTNDDWKVELYMSDQELTTARKKASRFLTVKKKGLPARNFYSVNWDSLEEAITMVTSDTRNYPHQSPQKLGSLDARETGVTITETTTETTTENTKDTPPIVPPRGDDVKPTDHVEIMKIMDLFYPTNPSLNFGRKSERDACRKLVKQFGLQETLKLVEAVVDFQGEPFSPVVTSPAALWEKLGKVAVFLKSGGRKDNSKRMGIHVLGKSKQSDNEII